MSMKGATEIQVGLLHMASTQPAYGQLTILFPEIKLRACAEAEGYEGMPHCKRQLMQQITLPSAGSQPCGTVAPLAAQTTNTANTANTARLMGMISSIIPKYCGINQVAIRLSGSGRWALPAPLPWPAG